MFNFIKNLFVKTEIPLEPETKVTEKEMATARGEPYIAVIDTHFDPKNPANGYFELDWNTHFIQQLVASGYTGNTEEEIVDKWFNAICQNVVNETNMNREVRVT